MEKSPTPKPTVMELAILRVLWERGPSTVRQVHHALNEVKKTGYTTVLKFLQIMHEKGMLQRDESSMTHIYSTELEEQKTKGVVLKKFVDAMYNGSVKSLMLELLGNEKTTNKEWDTIKDLLTKLDDDQ